MLKQVALLFIIIIIIIIITPNCVCISTLFYYQVNIIYRDKMVLLSKLIETKVFSLSHSPRLVLYLLYLVGGKGSGVTPIAISF